MNRLLKQNSFIEIKRPVLFLCLFLSFFPLCAENFSFIENAVKMNSPAESIRYLAENIETITNIEEKKQTLIFMANLQKQMGLFLDAYSY